MEAPCPQCVAIGEPSKAICCHPTDPRASHEPNIGPAFTPVSLNDLPSEVKLRLLRICESTDDNRSPDSSISGLAFVTKPFHALYQDNFEQANLQSALKRIADDFAPLAMILGNIDTICAITGDCSSDFFAIDSLSQFLEHPSKEHLRRAIKAHHQVLKLIRFLQQQLPMLYNIAQFKDKEKSELLGGVYYNALCTGWATERLGTWGNEVVLQAAFPNSDPASTEEEVTDGPDFDTWRISSEHIHADIEGLVFKAMTKLKDLGYFAPIVDVSRRCEKHQGLEPLERSRCASSRMLHEGKVQSFEALAELRTVEEKSKRETVSWAQAILDLHCLECRRCILEGTASKHIKCVIVH